MKYETSTRPVIPAKGISRIAPMSAIPAEFTPPENEDTDRLLVVTPTAIYAKLRMSKCMFRTKSGKFIPGWKAQDEFPFRVRYEGEKPE